MEIKRRNIKMDLQESIDKIEEEYSLYQQKENYYKMYEALCTMFSSNDVDTLIESAKLFPLIYEGLSSKEEAAKLSNEMLECLYLVKKVNEKDYQEYCGFRRSPCYCYRSACMHSVLLFTGEKLQQPGLRVCAYCCNFHRWRQGA